MKFAVVILAGGEGRRIGGEKPRRMLGGKTLMARAEAMARHWSDLSAASIRTSGQVNCTALDCIFDEPGIDGPLAGLVAALRFARDAGREAVLTIPADMPFLPADLAGRLTQAIGNAAAALARSGGRLHPVCGLWSTRTLETLPGYLASKRLSLKGLAETAGCIAVDWPATPIDPFFNINSEEDLRHAEEMLGGKS